MKRFLIIALCALLLAGCASFAQTETTTPIPETDAGTTAPELWYLIYTPNDNADGFNRETLTVTEITPESVLQELQKHNVLPEEVEINNLTIEGTQLNLDFNQAFADLICSMGTSGEMMIVGSVVNTYLSAYESQKVENVFFTIDGEILESGHVYYDFPIEKME